MKPLSFSSFFKKIYKHFYIYCLSGNEEDRKLLTKQVNIIDQTKDNILSYLFNIMCNADIMDRDEHRADFIKISGEFTDLNINALDTWCYHQVLFLSYTYIYPDMRTALKNKNCQKRHLISCRIKKNRTWRRSVIILAEKITKYSSSLPGK